MIIYKKILQIKLIFIFTLFTGLVFADSHNINEVLELIKKDINDIKNNHLQHIERDMRDVKIEVFRFKYVVWGALVIFILMTDKFTELLRLL